MTPPYMQFKVQELFKATLPPTKTVGEPGVQGAVVAGMQGMGVSTPKAAAVAEATVGFARELHMPKGKIFTKGALSMIEAMGMVDMTFPVGSTVKTEGAAPKLHCKLAPANTPNPICLSPYSSSKISVSVVSISSSELSVSVSVSAVSSKETSVDTAVSLIK